MDSMALPVVQRVESHINEGHFCCTKAYCKSMNLCDVVGNCSQYNIIFTIFFMYISYVIRCCPDKFRERMLDLFFNRHSTPKTHHNIFIVVYGLVKMIFLSDDV